MDMDIEPLKTDVFVHTPLIEYSSNGSYYTSYAIHLTSNNPCFTLKSSHVRRRYSEFAHLRCLLASHYPTVTPANLPPKNFFQRFSHEFVQKRMKGLQKFLEDVLATPVYLSDKSLHLFLQSSCSMSQIDEECIGDIPAPPLINFEVPITPSHSDTSSHRSSECSEGQLYARALRNLVIDNKEEKVQSDNSLTKTSESAITAPTTSKIKSHLMPALHKCDTRPCAIPRRTGSLESTPSSSPSSLETSYSSSSEPVRERHVSFSESVKIAVVTNYGISLLRS